MRSELALLLRNSILYKDLVTVYGDIYDSNLDNLYFPFTFHAAPPCVQSVCFSFYSARPENMVFKNVGICLARFSRYGSAASFQVLILYESWFGHFHNFSVLILYHGGNCRHLSCTCDPPRVDGCFGLSWLVSHPNPR